MKHIDLAAQGEAVQRFFQKLQVSGEGSVFELNGHAVARVVPVGEESGVADNGEDWTEAKNARRCKLIDREIKGTLTLEETGELARLQQQMLAYRDRVAPLPLEATRRLHQELMRKAARSSAHPE
jgi:hypothetical protein